MTDGAVTSIVTTIVPVDGSVNYIKTTTFNGDVINNSYVTVLKPE